MAKKKIIIEEMKRSEIVLRKMLGIKVDAVIDKLLVDRMAKQGHAVAKAYMRGD